MQTNERCRICTRLLIAIVVAGFLAIGNAVGSSNSNDMTDIWYNAAQSGKGVQMVHTGSFIFVTVYIYDQDRRPFWVTGELTRVGSALQWAGSLYVTTGPYFGDTFNPATVTSRQAGTMTFTFLTTETGTLDYSIDGVVVSESLKRQPLTPDNYNGSYIGVLTQTSTGCVDPALNGSAATAVGIFIVQHETAMTVQIVIPTGNTCTLQGTYSQLGRNGRLAGTYTCSDGEIGNAQVIEMNNHVRQFNGRHFLTSVNNGCSTVGRITGLNPN